MTDSFTVTPEWRADALFIGNYCYAEISKDGALWRVKIFAPGTTIERWYYLSSSTEAEAKSAVLAAVKEALGGR